MKKKVFIQLLLIYCIVLMQSDCIAQNLKKRDSLENYIKTAPQDSSKANALVLLSDEIIQYDLKKAEFYAYEAISIAYKIKSQKVRANALLAFSRIHRQKNNIPLALDKTITALRIFEALHDNVRLADAYYELGYIYKEIHNYQKSIDNFSKSLLLYDKTGDEMGVAKCQMVLGHVNMDQSATTNDTVYIKKALFFYDKALNYFKKINNPERISVAFLNIANLYLTYNKLSPSDEHLKKSLDYSAQSLKIAQELDDELRTGINFLNIGEAYYAQKKFDIALDYFLKAYELVKKSENKIFSLSALHNIMSTYKEIKEYDKALELSEKYIKMANEGHYNGYLKKHFQLLSEIYLAQHKLEKAFKSRLLYENYSDSLLNEGTTKALTRLQIEYESENKDKEIALLTKNRELQNAEIKQQNIIRKYLITSIILILLLLAVIYNRFAVKTKSNKIIEEKNKELEKLSIVARETANGVFITDANGDVEWFNEGFSKLFGWKSIQEYIKKRGRNIFEVSGNDNIENLIKESISQKKSVTYENATPTKSRNQLWIQTTLTPIFNEDGELSKLVFVETNITDLKNSEEQYLAVNNELEAFSYSVSHDLRSPLRAINGYSKIIQEDYASKMDTDGQNALNAIINNSKKMGELIDDLLTFSRLGRTELTATEINMTNLVNSIIKEEMAWNPAEIDFTVNNLHPAKGSQTLIKQVWVNLISNAIKFSKYNPKARIEIGSYFKDDYIVYYIKDYGVGFDMQYYDKLFGVFQRLHSSEEFEGTGIGLAIIQKIINRHNGKVWAESKLNEGTTFYFSLPNINT